MKKLFIAVLLLPFLIGCGHPVTIGLAIWLAQPGGKKGKDAPVYFELDIATTSLPYAVNGVAYDETVMAIGGTAPYTWNLSAGVLPSGVSLTTDTGQLSGTPADTPLTDYIFTLEVVDSVSDTAIRQFTITLYDPLQITYTPPLPDAVNGQAYGPETVTVAGGTGNTTWSIASGVLPSGVSLTTSNGEIAGTPSGAATSYSFTVSVRDDAVPPQTDTLDLTLNLHDPLTITTTTLPYAINGTFYSELLSATGGTGTYAWIESGGPNLPTGLGILASGVVEGTPSDTPGIYNFTVQVDDDGIPAQSTTQGLSVELYNPLVIASSTVLPTALTGSTYSEILAASGGDSNYTWSNPTSDLPAWLSLDPATGELYSATVGATGLCYFTIRVVDGESPLQMDEAVFALSVIDEIIWEDTFDSDTLIDTAESYDYAVTNGYVRNSATFGAEADDAFFNPANTNPEHEFGGDVWLAQTFTVEATGKLTSAYILHRREVGGGNRDMRFEIRDVVDGLPGSQVYCSVTWRPDRFWGWHGNAFPNPIDVYPGEIYALVIIGWPIATTHGATSDPGNPYAGGMACSSTDAGVNWVDALPGYPAADERDLGFLIRVTPPTAFNTPAVVESVTISPSPISEWGSMSWNADIPASATATVQVLYDNLGTWEPILNADLPGNEAGFTDPSVVVDLSTLTDLGKYGAIRLRATLTTSILESARVFDWRVTYRP
jgi:hypothetical protein